MLPATHRCARIALALVVSASCSAWTACTVTESLNRSRFAQAVPPLLLLPTSARLRSVRHTGTYPPMSFVPLLDVPRGQAGAVLLTSLSVGSATENFLEGCMRARIDNANTTTLLSSGTEDYFQSAFYFNAGTYQFSEAGLTHLNNSGVEGDPTRWTLSACG